MARRSTPALQFGAFRLDLAGGRLWHGPREVPLRRKAWQALGLLVQRAGELVPNEELLDTLWPQTEVHPKVLTNLVGEVRRALDDASTAPQWIQTVHRRGYRFIGKVEPGAAADPGDKVLETAWATARLLVGREAELAALGQGLAAATQARRQLLLVSGDAGMGKTALIDVFTAPLSTLGLWVGRGQCMEQHTERETFGPVLGLLSALAGGPQGDRVRSELRRCAPSWLLQLPWLLATGEAETLGQKLVGVGPGRMLRECCALLEALAQDQVLVLVLEDLQWSDPATVDLLAHLAQGMAPARLLLVGTLRADDTLLQAHPAASLARRLASHAQTTALALPLLSSAQVLQLIERRFGDAELASRLAPQLQRQSEGHPLFLNALLDHLVEQGRLVSGTRGWVLAEDAASGLAVLPDRLRTMIEVRLAGLAAEEQTLLEAASAIGAQFSLQLLAAALQRPMPELEAACQGLVRRQRFLRTLAVAQWPDGSSGAVFAFVHQVYQQVLYDGLLPAVRQGLHRRIALRLEQGFCGRMAEVAGPLAAAYERAAMPDDTARVLELSAAVSARRFAYREVAGTIEASLRQLALLPDTEAQAARRIRLQLTLGNLCLAGHGSRHGDALLAFRAAEALCGRLDQPRLQLRAQLGICVALIIAGQPGVAQQVGRHLVQGAQDRQPSLQAIAHTHAGLADLACGALPQARQHLEQALRLPPDPEVPMLSDTHGLAALHLGRTLGHMGQLAQAEALVDAAVQRIRRGGAPFQVVGTLHTAAEHALLMGRAPAARALFDEVLALADEHALPHHAVAGRLGRWGTWPAQDRPLAELTALVQQALAAGEHWGRVGFLLLLAETQAALGDGERALATLDQALASLDSCPLISAEVYRMKAQVLACGGADGRAAAQACLQTGLGLARLQQAQVQALRCALGLQRLMAQTDDALRGHQVLAEVVAGFGADAVHPDLQHARQQLAQAGQIDA